MDDIIEGTTDLPTAQKLMQDIDTLIIKGGFKLKEWVFSCDSSNGKKSIPNESNVATERVLGVNWDPIKDHLCFSAKLNFFSNGKRKVQKDNPNNDLKLTPPLTKQMTLSQVNSMYDPLGLAGPFTVRAKILMRHLWANSEKLDWGDPILEDNKQWSAFFNELPEMNQVKFERCLKPSDTICNPVLIIFCDASEDAYRSCTYVRWQRQGGGFAYNLIVSKNRLAPIKKMSIDKIELCAAVLSKRLKSFIDKECRYTFLKCYYVVDSQIQDDGIYVISGRAEKWLEIGYNKEDIILLPYQHRFAQLYCVSTFMLRGITEFLQLQARSVQGSG